MHSLDIASLHAAERIRTACADRTVLRIRGGGSKDFYGHSLQGELLDTTPLRGMVSYEPSELVVTVGAGTPLVELEAALAEQGQCLPFEPPHFAWSGLPQGPSSQATVGGMVAAGLSGPSRASVGGVRDYVLGLKMVNGRGEALTFGGQVMKNVAGYDVSRLMVGAMGTLGLVTEVSLKVLSLAPAEATLVFGVPQHDALEQLHRWGGQPLPLNASMWVSDVLWVRLRGAVAAVEAACHSMLADLPGQRMDRDLARADWAGCRHQHLPFFAAPQAADRVLWRMSVPQTATVLDLPWPQLMEWHGGLRWVWAPLDAQEQVQQAATQAGGSATLFIAARAGSMRASGQFGIKNSAQWAITQRLKASFDPAGILNPGRLFSDLSSHP